MKIHTKIVVSGLLMFGSLAHGVMRYATIDEVMTEIPQLKTYITNATNRPIIVRQVRAAREKWIALSTRSKEAKRAPSQSFKEELINAHVIQPGQTVDLYMAGGEYNDFLMGYADEESGNTLKVGDKWDKGFINSQSTASHWAQGHRGHWLVIFGCNDARALDLLQAQYGKHTILLKSDYTPGRVRVRCNGLDKLNAAIFDGRNKSIGQVRREVSNFISDLQSAQGSVGQ